MQQQQLPPTLNSGTPPPPFPPNSITTEQIEKCLDENSKLILAILENQNLGKHAECGQLQALLQKNLMYLAAFADAQPPPSGLSQVPLNSVTQQGNYMQQQHQGAVLQQQPQGMMLQQQHQVGGSVPKLPFQLNAVRSQDQQQLRHFQQQQQQHIHAQMGLRPNGMHVMHQMTQHGLSNSADLMDARGSKQDGSRATPGGQGKSASGRGSSNRESDDT